MHATINLLTPIGLLSVLSRLMPPIVCITPVWRRSDIFLRKLSYIFRITGNVTRHFNHPHWWNYIILFCHVAQGFPLCNRAYLFEI